MAISFAQSMQSIQRDHGRFSLAGTILALLAVLVWGAWFFLSPIPVYEYGVIVKSTRDGYPEVDIDLARRMAEGESGEAEIEVERISPARLVLRVSGQFVETAPVSFMPKAQ